MFMKFRVKLGKLRKETSTEIKGEAPTVEHCSAENVPLWHQESESS